MSDPYECQEYQDFRSDRTVCTHGSLRRCCADCEVDVQDAMIERLSAELEIVEASLEALQNRWASRGLRTEQLEAAMQEFVDRCAKGEILSKYTRAKFEQLLAGNVRPDTTEPLDQGEQEKDGE